MTKLFLHQLPDAKALFEVVANERQLQPSIIEKDYWVMHCLWGLKSQGIKFEGSIGIPGSYCTST